MEISWNFFISQNGGIIPYFNLGLNVMPMGGKETLNTFLNAKIRDIYNCLIFFYYFIVINIILVDVFHDVTKNKKTRQLCYKKIHKHLYREKSSKLWFRPTITFKIRLKLCFYFDKLFLGATEDGEIGTHVLQMLTKFSHLLVANFVSTTATIEQMLRYFWKVV